MLGPQFEQMQFKIKDPKVAPSYEEFSNDPRTVFHATAAPGDLARLKTPEGRRDFWAGGERFLPVAFDAPSGPRDDTYFLGNRALHAGTRQAAEDRGQGAVPFDSFRVFPLQYKGPIRRGMVPDFATHHFVGRKAIRYVNDSEDPGSISMMGPGKNYRTYGQTLDEYRRKGYVVRPRDRGRASMPYDVVSRRRPQPPGLAPIQSTWGF